MRGAARGLAVGCAAVLLADAPGLFTRGDVLRRPLLAALATAALLLGAGRLPRPRRLALLALVPLAVPLAAVLALPRGTDLTVVALLRESATWTSLACIGLGLLLAWRDPDETAATWRALVLAGAVAAAWTLGDALVGWGVGVGPFGRPGIAGPVLAALAAAALVAPGIPWRPVVALVLAAGCVATRSRTGIAAGAIAALLAASVVAPPVWARRLRVALPALLLVGGVVGALLFGGVLDVEDDTLDVRLGLYRAGVALVNERPVLGHGLATLPGEVLRVRDAEEARISGGRRPDQVHADALHVAAEGGLVALAAFLAWLVATGALCVTRAWGGQGDDPHRRLAGAALAVLAALAVASLGEEVLADPAGALLAAVASATALVGARSALAPSGRGVATALVLLALLPAGAAYATARAAAADRSLRAYRDGIQGPVTRERAEELADERLVGGVLAWRGDHPEGHYRLGVHRAKTGRLDEARDELRAALRSDPGRTEARLDLAKTYEIEGRTADALAVLREAQRRDPTRYEVPLRLGQVTLGPEPVPGDPPDGGIEPIPVLRSLNEAAALAPGRFETPVAHARLARRQGRLDEAGLHLEAARQIAPRAAELRLEAFRWQEARARRAGQEELLVTALEPLVEALFANPNAAGEVRAEAERFLDEGERREEEARKRAAADPAAADFSAGDRAFHAAAIRLSALVRLDPATAGDLRALARAEAGDKRWRRSLARYRALVPWAEHGLDPADVPAMGRLLDLYLEAARVATRTDAPLARVLFARGHVVLAIEHLAHRRNEEAESTLLRMLDEGHDTSEVRWLLARALARQGELDAAEDHLRRAIELEPSRRDAVASEPDLAPLRDRVPK